MNFNKAINLVTIIFIFNVPDLTTPAGLMFAFFTRGYNHLRCNTFFGIGSGKRNFKKMLLLGVYNITSSGITHTWFARGSNTCCAW